MVNRRMERRPRLVGNSRLVVAGSASIWLAHDVSSEHGANNDKNDVVVKTVDGCCELVRKVLAPENVGSAWIRWYGSEHVVGRPSDDWSMGGEFDQHPFDDLKRWLGVDGSGRPASGHRPAANDAWRYQVLLDRRRFESLCGGSSELAAYWVMLDFRFAVACDEVRCVVSHSVWSGLPCAVQAGSGGDIAGDAASGDLEVHWKTWRWCRHRIEQLLCGQLQRLEPLLFGDCWQAPDFWIVFDDRVECRQSRNSDANVSSVEGDMSGRLLSLLGLDRGRMSRPVELGGSQSHSAFIPLARAWATRQNSAGNPVEQTVFVATAHCGGNSAGTRERTFGMVVDWVVAEVVAVAGLAAILDGLAIWENHIAVYNAVAERGSSLWDAIVTHLPVARGKLLAKAHRAIELIHQIMLHGVADLEELGHHVRDSGTVLVRLERETKRRLVDMQATPVAAGADGDSHVPVPVPVELLARVKERCLAAESEARRVSENYAQLIQTIGNAFDERRVRESDGLARSNATLNAVLGAIGLVTVADVVVQLKPDDDAPEHTLLFESLRHHLPAVAQFLQDNVSSAWLGWPTVFVGVALLLVLSRTLGSIFLNGRLGRRRFRKLFKGSLWRRGNGVWRFLRMASNDVLNEVVEICEQSPGTLSRGTVRNIWTSVDRDLSSRLAAIWDRCDLVDDGIGWNIRGWLIQGGGHALLRPSRPHSWLYRLWNARRALTPRSTDVEMLYHRVEQWAVRALVLSERPRHLFHFRLPRLTCLYQVCAEVDGSFRSSSEDGVQVRPVPDYEFTRIMLNQGLEPERVAELRRDLDLIVQSCRDGHFAGGIRGVLARLNDDWFETVP